MWLVHEFPNTLWALGASYPLCFMQLGSGRCVNTQLSLYPTYYADDDMFRPLWAIFRSQKWTVSICYPDMLSGKKFWFGGWGICPCGRDDDKITKQAGIAMTLDLQLEGVCLKSWQGFLLSCQVFRCSLKTSGKWFSAPVQTSPGAHPASCTMGTGSFPGVKSSRGVLLTTHPLLVLWSRKSRATPLLPLWAVQPVQSLSACTRVHVTFYLTMNI